MDDADARAERQITLLLRQYARALDTRDWDLLASCFTPDADVTFRGFGRHRGRDALVAACRASLSRFTATQHMITNELVDRPAGGSTTASSYVRAMHVRTFGDDTTGQLTLWGRYIDAVVPVHDGWAIARRELSVVWQDGDPRVMT